MMMQLGMHLLTRIGNQDLTLGSPAQHCPGCACRASSGAPIGIKDDKFDSMRMAVSRSGNPLMHIETAVRLDLELLKVPLHICQVTTCVIIIRQRINSTSAE